MCDAVNLPEGVRQKVIELQHYFFAQRQKARIQVRGQKRPKQHQKQRRPFAATGNRDLDSLARMPGRALRRHVCCPLGAEIWWLMKSNAVAFTGSKTTSFDTEAR